MAIAALAWIAIDARLMVAVLTLLAATGIQSVASEISFGHLAQSSLPFLLVVAALMAPSVWQLRRQSARQVRTA